MALSPEQLTQLRAALTELARETMADVVKTGAAGAEMNVHFTSDEERSAADEMMPGIMEQVAAEFRQREQELEQLPEVDPFLN